MPIISTNISHTTKAHSILSTLSTPALRRYASRKSLFMDYLLALTVFLLQPPRR
ncbi:hypothetical protein ML8HA_02464 [Lactococcus lactis]|nr:hypothetical protein [Lactococcus lactis]